MFSHPKRRTIEVNSELNSEVQINSFILCDFTEFKNKNELQFCSLFQEKPSKNSVDVVWSTTVKYPTKDFDYQSIMNHFRNFARDNEDEYCQITKVTCQENCFIAEFSIRRHYEWRFV